MQTAWTYQFFFLSSSKLIVQGIIGLHNSCLSSPAGVLGGNHWVFMGNQIDSYRPLNLNCQLHCSQTRDNHCLSHCWTGKLLRKPLQFIGCGKTFIYLLEQVYFSFWWRLLDKVWEISQFEIRVLRKKIKHMINNLPCTLNIWYLCQMMISVHHIIAPSLWIQKHSRMQRSRS